MIGARQGYAGLVFPSPTPWPQLGSVDPAREYVAFTSRFFLKSLRRVPAFVARSMRIMKQASAAPGMVGWSLGGHLFKLEFYTLSVWQDDESLRRFVREGDHRAAVEEFERDVRRKASSCTTRYWDGTCRSPGRMRLPVRGAAMRAPFRAAGARI